MESPGNLGLFAAIQERCRFKKLWDRPRVFVMQRTGWLFDTPGCFGTGFSWIGRCACYRTMSKHFLRGWPRRYGDLHARPRRDPADQAIRACRAPGGDLESLDLLFRPLGLCASRRTSRWGDAS